MGKRNRARLCLRRREFLGEGESAKLVDPVEPSVPNDPVAFEYFSIRRIGPSKTRGGTIRDAARGHCELAMSKSFWTFRFLTKSNVQFMVRP
jgi:hypothetical protein